MTAAADLTFANTSIDASLTASNNAVDAVHAYVVASIGVNLIASTAATGFALLREHSAINAMTTAQKEAINAACAATLANLASDLIGRNASEALDDPIAIANATNNAAQAVKSAWQNVNNLQSRAASTFAGTGPGGFAMTFVGFTGWFDGGWFSWPVFFSATGTTFTSGEAYDSLLGATHSMLDTMSFGYTNCTDSGPLYGNAQAYLNGKGVGFYWGVSNYVAIAGYGGWRLIVGPAAVNPNSSNYFGQFDSSRYPSPPGWNPGWKWGPPSTGEGTWRWFDPAGGEWRRHFVDSWHAIEHWDYNPWTNWNSPWQNIP